MLQNVDFRLLQQGQKRSQEPTGLSSLARYAYGFACAGSEDTIRAARESLRVVETECP